MSTRRSAPLLGALVAGCLGILLCVAGLALDVGPFASTTSAPSRPARSATALVLEGMAGTEVRSVSLVGTRASGSGPRVHVQVDSAQGDDVYVVWLGGLVQGALADRMRDGDETTADVIAGGQVEDRDESGAPVTVPLGSGSVAGGQVFESPNDDDLEARAAAAARKFGLELVSVQVMHPLESAISVRFALAGDGDLDWTIDDLRDAVAGSPSAVEGVFIEIDSSAGKPLLRTGAAYRMGEGGLWFAPGQDDRFGAVHSSLGHLPAT